MLPNLASQPMHWFPLLVRNGLVGAALLLLVQTLVPMLSLWAIVPLLLVLLWTLYATARSLWQHRAQLPGWGVVGVCWGVFLLATGAYFAAGHLRRGRPLATLFSEERDLPTFFAWGLLPCLLVVAAVWWQYRREAKIS